MNRNSMKRVFAAVSIAAMSACTSTTPYLDTVAGEAVNRAKLQQTLDPDAGATVRPVAELDGVSAKESVGRYHDSFKAPPPTFEVIFGGGSSGNGR